MLDASLVLIEDRTSEIPPFLQRNDDGSLKHPNIAIPTAPPSVLTAEDERQLNRWGFPINPKDAISEQRIRDELSREEAAKKAVVSKEHRTQKKIERERLAENAKKQRRVFMQHFHWDLPKAGG